MKIMKKIFALSVLAAISLTSQAATTTANFTSSATLNQTCVISTNGLAFGAITPAATSSLTSTGTIESTCSNGTAYTLELNKGEGVSISDRAMKGSTGNTDKLSYNLYAIIAGQTYLFGNGIEGSKISGVGTGAQQSQLIYGVLPYNQYVKADSYIDNLVVTLSY